MYQKAINIYRHPWQFYGLSTFIPWIFWFLAAYISHQTWAEHYTPLLSFLGLAGLISPVVIIIVMVRNDLTVRNDIIQRLFSMKAVAPKYWVITFFLMLGSILLAQVISLAFGYSVEQFTFSGKTSFTAGIFAGWFLLLLAPLIEELAWHSYGMDSLRSRMNLLSASLIFGIFWVIWHLPLSFIKDYYHSNVVQEGLIYSLNFAFSLIPFVIIMNWLYYKTDRNIWIAIIFHISAGCFNELFNTHPMSKVIQTGLLIILSIILIVKDKEFFFNKKYIE